MAGGTSAACVARCRSNARRGCPSLRGNGNRIRSCRRTATSCGREHHRCIARTRRPRFGQRNRSAVARNSFFARLGALYCAATRQSDKLQPLLLLAFRLYVARVFFMSGLTKIHDWSVTVALFTDEYHVPLLPPGIAALMGTATELSMPVLLAVGLATRFGAFVLFFFNIIAVVSYAALPDVAVKDHYLWCVLILVVLVFGPGKISLDHWLEGRRSR